MTDIEYVWVFNAEGGRFPGAVFAARDLAEAWVRKHRLTGVLTRYPLDTGVYEWAVKAGHFSPKSHQLSGTFIGRFTSANMEHMHFERGASAEDEDGE